MAENPRKGHNRPFLWERNGELAGERLSVRKSIRFSQPDYEALAHLARNHQLPLAKCLRHLVLGVPLAPVPPINLYTENELARVAGNLTQLQQAHRNRAFPSIGRHLVDAQEVLAVLRNRLLNPSKVPLGQTTGFHLPDVTKPKVLVVRFKPSDRLPSPLVSGVIPIPDLVYRSIQASTKGLLYNLGILLNGMAYRSNAGKLADVHPGFLDELMAAFHLALGEL